MEAAELEGIAQEVWEGTGELLPVDAFELAGLLGLEVRAWMKATGRVDVGRGIVWFPGRARLVRQHGVVAHETGHWLLHQAGEEHRTEWAARYLAGALMLPRAPFLADAKACDWELEELRTRHPNASAEMIVVRMTQVSTATAWVWDDGYVRRAYGADAGEDVEAIVGRVLAAEAPLRDGAVRAWPLLEQGHRRVVVVRLAA